MSTTHPHTIPTCPFNNRTWRHNAPSTTVTPGQRRNPYLTTFPKAFRTHLLAEHGSETTYLIPPTFFLDCNLYPCEHCHRVDKIYLHRSHLDNHINAHHPSTRTLDNIAIVADSLPSARTDPNIRNSWLESLKWLLSLQITPPPYSHSVWRSLKPAQKMHIFPCSTM